MSEGDTKKSATSIGWQNENTLSWNEIKVHSGQANTVATEKEKYSMFIKSLCRNALIL